MSDKTLKWVATGNDLFTLVGKDAYAVVEENSEKWASERRWRLSFKKYNGIDLTGDSTAHIYFHTLEEAFDKVNDYNLKGMSYREIYNEIDEYYVAHNSDIAP